MAKVITVFGATGQQGGSVANALLDGGIYRVRAVTRNTGSEAAQKLKARGAELVTADLNDKTSVVKAVKGSYGCFGVTNFWPDMDKQKEKTQGINIADACKQAGVYHLVFSGLENVQKTIGIACPHFDGKGEVEEYLQKSTIPFTVVRVAGYSENFLATFTPQKIGDNKYALFVPMADKEIPLISVAEIGECVHQIFQHRQQYLCKFIGLCSDNITIQKVSEIMSKVLEKDIVDGQMTVEAFAKLGFPGADDMAAMFSFYQSGQLVRDPALTRKLNPKLSSFEQWVIANKETILKTVPA